MLISCVPLIQSSPSLFLISCPEQLNVRAEFQREVDLIQKETENRVESILANITVIRQNATSTADLIIQTAKVQFSHSLYFSPSMFTSTHSLLQAQANKIQLTATGQGLSNLFTSLSLTDPTERKALFDLLTVLDSKSSPQLLVGDLGVVISRI